MRDTTCSTTIHLSKEEREFLETRKRVTGITLARTVREALQAFMAAEVTK